MVRVARTFVLCGLAMVMACSSGDPPASDGAVIDALADAAADAATDARVDAPTDARVDAPIALIDAAIDAPIDAPGPTTCDPLAAPGLSGCPIGEKCSWLVVAEEPFLIANVGCVPDGTVASGDTCVRGIPGETTGFDDCAAGLICVSGTCRDICGFDGSPAAACAVSTSCTRYAGIFVDFDGFQFAGACNPNCDPLTQLQVDGTPCGTGLGCYVVTSELDTAAVCAFSNTVGHNQPIVGPLYANSCAPGHTFRRTAPGSSTYECTALCRPADVYMGNNVSLEGGVAPYTCAAAGAALPSHPTLGESCRYWWSREAFSGLSQFSNTLGYCFEHASWTYDSDFDGVPDAAFPRCPTLTTGDVVPPIDSPPHNDAEYFYCIQTLPSFAKAFAPVARLAMPMPRVDQLAP